MCKTRFIDFLMYADFSCIYNVEKSYATFQGYLYTPNTL